MNALSSLYTKQLVMRDCQILHFGGCFNHQVNCVGGRNCFQCFIHAVVKGGLPPFHTLCEELTLKLNSTTTFFKYMASPAITACFSVSNVINSINCYSQHNHISLPPESSPNNRDYSSAERDYGSPLQWLE